MVQGRTKKIKYEASNFLRDDLFSWIRKVGWHTRKESLALIILYYTPLFDKIGYKRLVFHPGIRPHM